MKNEIRTKIAKEAARLLYFNFVDDYKSAKKIARDRLGKTVLPNNLEVAIELDKLADEIEGSSRIKFLIKLRNEALQIMDKLEHFNPRLIGSVWRGTAKKGSDIDITVYSDKPKAVVNLIKKENDNVRVAHINKTTRGDTKRYFHIYFNCSLGQDVEVVVRSSEAIHERYKCEIYGDYVTGLTRIKLRELLERDPAKKFLP